jgi:4-carboxymuconolactone decarboxylase
MKRIAVLIIAVLCLCGNLKAEEKNQTQNKEEIMKMEIMPKGTQKSFKGPEEWFTGDVQVDMLFPSNEVAHYSGAYVTFQPGARTAWHLHPAGQHMIVTSGVGLTGTRDGKIVTMHAGDTVWCPPDIDHWHGATPDSPMTHLVVTGELDGKNVVWKEKVTDEQYLGK